MTEKSRVTKKEKPPDRVGVSYHVVLDVRTGGFWVQVGLPYYEVLV